MAHMIEDYDVVLSTDSPEWHGLAQVVQAIDDESIAPLLFPIVEGSPSVTLPDGTSITVEGYKMLVADIRHRTDLGDNLGQGYVPLHIPKASYQVIPNRDVWEMVRNSFEGLGAKITTAGTLNNLKTFMVSVDIGTDEFKAANGDIFRSYMSFLTSHNGVFALSAFDTSVRMVCMNTVQAAIAQAGDFGVKIYHTANVKTQMDYLPEYLAAVIANRKALMANYNSLMQVPCKRDEALHAAAGFLAGESDDRLSTLSYNRANDIQSLMIGGVGNRGETRYDLLNGVTEYFTHHEGAGGKKADRMKRLCASKFGAAAEHKEQFLNLVLDEERYRETVDRGERLYKEKHQLVMAN